jgi:hypothetical protein
VAVHLETDAGMTPAVEAAAAAALVGDVGPDTKEPEKKKKKKEHDSVLQFVENDLGSVLFVDECFAPSTTSNAGPVLWGSGGALSRFAQLLAQLSELETAHQRTPTLPMLLGASTNSFMSSNSSMFGSSNPSLFDDPAPTGSFARVRNKARLAGVAMRRSAAAGFQQRRSLAGPESHFTFTI